VSLTRNALLPHLHPVNAAGGKNWRLEDQAVAMLERGRQLVSKHNGQQHAFYLWVAAA
jgi:hypothetical protein